MLSERHTEQLHTGPMHDCGHGIIMAMSMAQLHTQVMTSGMSLQRRRRGRQSTSMCAVLPRGVVMSSLDTLQRVGVSATHL